MSRWKFRLYHEARDLSVASAIAQTLTQMLVFWALFLWVLPSVILFVERLADRPLGVLPFGRDTGLALFVASSLLGIWSALTMSMQGRGTPIPMQCAPRLVVRGPYRFVRNPMAVAGIAQGVGLGLFRTSPTLLIYALVGGAIWHWCIRPSEEADLVKRFGAPYLAYRERTALWWPRRRDTGS